MDKDDELFKGSSFADLMSDVYHNSKKKDRQMNQLIASLQPLIKNASDATIIIPLIKEILDVSIKNDDQLVKLTAIAQRYISTKQTITGADSLLSDDEKEQLLKAAADTLTDDLHDVLTPSDDFDTTRLAKKVEDVKAKLEKDINASN
jgi:hypothetical protein